MRGTARGAVRGGNMFAIRGAAKHATACLQLFHRRNQAIPHQKWFQTRRSMFDCAAVCKHVFTMRGAMHGAARGGH
eukprot:11205902-Lingulodinium_polyedra.AAC.1